MAEKGLTFASQRKAADRTLELLREVEEAHRGFHYAFELALYASLRDESAANTPVGSEYGAAGAPSVAASSGVFGGGGRGGYRRMAPPPVRAVGGSMRSPPVSPRPAGSGGGGGGGGGYADLGSMLRTPRLGTGVASGGGGGDIGGENGYAYANQRLMLRSPRGRGTSARSGGGGGTSAAAPMQRALDDVATDAGVASDTAGVSPQRLRLGRGADDAAAATDTEVVAQRRNIRPARASSRRRVRRTNETAADHQQFVVLYLPQGPDGGGPRAILVPADALQQAPEPLPAAMAALPSPTRSPPHQAPALPYNAFMFVPQQPQQGVAAAPALSWGGYMPEMTAVAPPPVVPPPAPIMMAPSAPLPQQPLPYASYTYTAKPSTLGSAPAPSPPATYVPHSRPTASYSPRSTASYRTDAERVTSTAVSDAALRTSTDTSPAVPYRYYTPPAAAAPSLHRLENTYPPAAAGGGTPSPSLYGTGLVQTLQPLAPMSPMPTPPPAVLAAAAAAQRPPSPPADLHFASFYPRPPVGGTTSKAGSLGAVPAVVPGATPGSVMMLQPLAAHATSTGAVVLQPKSDLSQPPMLLVAQDPAAMAAAAATGTGGRFGSSEGGSGITGRSSGRIRFSNRRGGRSGRGRGHGEDGEEEGWTDEEEEESRDDDDKFEEGGNHQTRSYLPDRQRSSPARKSAARQRSPSRGTEKPLPKYLTHYLGAAPYREDADVVYEPLSMYDGEVYGSGSSGVRFNDSVRHPGVDSDFTFTGTGDTSAGAGGNRWDERDASGAAVKQLVSNFCDRRDNGDEMASGDDLRGILRSPLKSVRPVLPRPPPVRDAEVELLPATPPRRGLVAVAADGGASGSGRTHLPPGLSYKRLAALVGLDPDLVGGGAAAGIATLPYRAGSASASGASNTAATRPPPYVVPGESSLQRAERLADVVERGDWAAAVELAGLVRSGGWWGDSRDAAVARGLLRQAALRGGSADAHAALGEMSERGEGLPGGRPDLPAAVRHYSAAAAGGHRDATTGYAYLLEHGLGVQQDEARAAQLYAAAAQRKCPTACNNLAKMILDGRGDIITTANGGSAVHGNSTGKTSGRTGGTAGLTWSTTAGAVPTTVHGNGNGNGTLSPLALAKALFKRAAQAGSAAAWYNLGVCYLQQLKQLRGPGGANWRVSSVGGLRASGVVHPSYTDAAADLEDQALRCFGEAAKRGHARAALRAGHLHLQRSAAAAAVEAFASVAINAVAAAATAPPPPVEAPAVGGRGWDVDGSDTASTAGGGGRAGTTSKSAAAAALGQIEAEALWCLAQLSERQAAVLEVKTAAGVPLPSASPPPPPLAAAGATQRTLSSRTTAPVAPGTTATAAPAGGAGSRPASGRLVSGDLPSAGDIRSGGSGAGASVRASAGGSAGGAGDVYGIGGAGRERSSGTMPRLSLRNPPEGPAAAAGGGVGGLGVRSGGVPVSGESGGLGGDGASSLSTGTESRAVGQLLANLVRAGDAGGGTPAAMAAAESGSGGGGAYDSALDDPAAAAAVAFARELCRLDFECCRRPAGTAPHDPVATRHGPLQVQGLRRLRRQARDLIAEAGGAAAAAADGADDARSSAGSSAASDGAAGGGPMAAALARLDLELQQPGERARGARRAAADLMTAAAALGHAAAQHWLAGWEWSMGRQAAAVVLWEAAGRRGHGASLMVLGRMAEAGQLTGVRGQEGGGGGKAAGGGSEGADLAAAARWYLRAQEAGAPGAFDAMQRVQRLLQRHVKLQGRVEAVAAVGGGGAWASAKAAAGGGTGNRRP